MSQRKFRNKNLETRSYKKFLTLYFSSLTSHLSPQRGFTLIELVVYIGVFTIFLSITTGVFTTILDVQVESSTTSVVQQDSRFLLERLSYDIRRADSVLVPENPGGESTMLQLDINGETYTYTLNSNNIFLTTNIGSYRLNSEETTVTDLSFVRLGESGEQPSIIIDFDIESIGIRPSGPEQMTIHTAVGAR